MAPPLPAEALLALAGLLALLWGGAAGAPGGLLEPGPLGLEPGPEDYPDYGYGEPNYQRVMPKRAALLFDRLLVALQKAVENDEMERDGAKTYVRPSSDFSDFPDSPRMLLTDEKAMDLQRRGQAKGRVYWRCYFNAVTCFKRK